MKKILITAHCARNKNHLHQFMDKQRKSIRMFLERQVGKSFKLEVVKAAYLDQDERNLYFKMASKSLTEHR